MKKIILKNTVAATLLCLCFAISPAQAATSVGKAIISIGKVFATSKDGVETKLKRRGKVYEGDTIKVGNKSRLQIRFIDNQLVVLKANTVFRIDEYKFKDKNDNNKSAALSLLKGGMRSVTGLIGKSARDKYKVRTPVATMGVRGTHYVLQICNGQCGEGVQGLVGTVLEGQIEMVNDSGSQVFGTDQFFNVPSMNEAPKTITNPPAVLISRGETAPGEGEGDAPPGSGDGTAEGDAPPPADGDGTTLAEGDAPPPPPPGDDAPPPPPPGDGGGSTFTSGEQTTVTTTTGTVSTTSPPSFIPGTPAPFGAGLVIAGITADVDGAGGIVGVQGLSASIGLATVNMVGNQPVFASISDMAGTVDYDVLGGGVATEQGGNGMLGINWGRWASNDTIFHDDNGVETALLTGIAFVYSDNLTSVGALSSFMSTNTYNLSAGPSIRDESGGLVTGSFSIMVDFSAAMGSGAVTAVGGTLSGNMRTYSSFALGSVVSLPNLLSGQELDITGMCSGAGGACAGGVTLTGSAGAAFVGPGAEALIGYFGLNSSGGTIGISGAGVFTPMSPPM